MNNSSAAGAAPFDSRVIIHPATGGMFFVASATRVWDGAEWRGFGEAEKYPSYPLAMKARREAVAKMAAMCLALAKTSKS